MYWHRESPGSTAEVDYLVQLGNEIIPLEVKEGASGRMRSLHLFLKEKRGERGVRISSKGFGFDGDIQNVPLYAVERLFAGKHNARKVSSPDRCGQSEIAPTHGSPTA